jgi:hypothetical protein
VTLPSHTIPLELIRVADETPSVPHAPRKPSSYEVRIRDGINDTVWLIGHNRHGEPMVSVVMARRHLKYSSFDALENWCRLNDDPVQLDAS